MLEYFQINICFFLLTCLALFYLKRSIARVRFYICLLGLLVWFVPWHMMSFSLPYKANESIKIVKIFQPIEIEQVFLKSSAQPKSGYSVHSTYSALQSPGESRRHPVNQDQSIFSGLKLQYLFWFLMLPGLVFFTLMIRGYNQLRQDLEQKSRDPKELEPIMSELTLSGVRVLRARMEEPGISLGILKPTIWINENIQDKELLRAILVHELTHIRNKDTIWVWLIEFARCVFWWNPCVKYLANSARKEVELSCDDSSQKRIGRLPYITSLAKLIVGFPKEDSTSRGIVLAVRAKHPLNVQRIEALANLNKFRLSHAFLITAFFFGVTTVSVSIAYDQRLTDFVQEKTATYVPGSASEHTIEYPLGKKYLIEFMDLVSNKQLEKAKLSVSSMVNRVSLEQSHENRLLGFRVLAAYFGEIGDYQSILSLADNFLDPQDKTDNYVSKILAVAMLKQGQVDQAIQLIENAEYLRFRGYPTRLLLASAYYLKKDHMKTIELVEEALQYRKLAPYNWHRISLIKLMGKSGELTKSPAIVKKAQALLDLPSEYQFPEVDIDRLEIPHVYFAYEAIDGMSIKGFDFVEFPLDQKLPELSQPTLQTGFLEAVRLANRGKYSESRRTLYHLLAQTHSYGKKAEIDHIRIQEYLFVLLLQLNDEQGLLDLSRSLIGSESVSNPIKARAYWHLASGLRTYTFDGLQYFSEYERMLGEPTLASDHEKLDRFAMRGNAERVRDSLKRVVEFYRKNNIYPDIRTLNSIISYYEKYGEKQTENKYRDLFRQLYPKALNYTMEIF